MTSYYRFGNGRDTANGMRLLGIQPLGWKEPRRSLRRLLTGRAAAPDAVVATALCPDLSQWDKDHFDIACFKGHDIVSVMLQLTDGFGPEAAQRCIDGGMPIDVGYCFPYFSHATTQPQRITETLAQRCIDYKVPIALFDAELDDATSPPTVADRQRQTRECMAILEQAKLRRRIYTAPWYWTPALGNTTEFYEMGIEHHLANYGSNDGKQPAIRTNSAGYAWPYNVAHQYWSLANYCGRVERDMNYVFSDGLPEGAEMALTEDDVKRIVNDVIEQRIDDGEIAGSSLVAGDTFVTLLQQAMGMTASTFTDANGNPDIRTGPTGTIRAWLSGLGSGADAAVNEIVRRLTNG